MARLLALFVLAALALPSSLGFVTKGSFKTISSWEFATRFCFSGQSIEDKGRYGYLKYDVEMRKSDRISLLFYANNWGSWRELYGEALTCAERIEQASVVLNLWDKVPPESHNDTSVDYVRLEGEFDFLSSSNRYTFLVFSNCDQECTGSFCQGPLDIPNYEFTFLNGDDKENNQFGCDQMGLFQAYTAFLALQFIVVSAGYIVKKALLLKNTYHHTVKILIFSINVQLLGDVGGFVFYGQFRSNGQARNGWLIFSDVFGTLSTAAIILKLILVAKGWTIVRRKISPGGRVRLSVYMTLYTILAFAVVAWKWAAFDLAETDYMYSSGAGKLLVVVRGLTTAWFLYATYTTMRNYRSKHSFYTKFFFCYGGWLVWLPITYGICQAQTQSKRERTAYVMGRAGILAVHITLLILYNPSTRFNKSFPFHAQTSAMLGISKPMPGTSGTAGGVSGGLSSEGGVTALAEGRDSVGLPPASSGLEMTRSGAEQSAGVAKASLDRADMGPQFKESSLLSGVPLVRVAYLARNIRQRLGILQNFSDDLTVALDDAAALENDPDQDVELPLVGRDFNRDSTRIETSRGALDRETALVHDRDRDRNKEIERGREHEPLREKTAPREFRDEDAASNYPRQGVALRESEPGASSQRRGSGSRERQERDTIAGSIY